jgi:hypothetical protein
MLWELPSCTDTYVRARQASRVRALIAAVAPGARDTVPESTVRGCSRSDSATINQR